MKKILLCLAALALSGSPALASGTHDAGHGQAAAMAAGEPGEPAAASRTIAVAMTEAADGGMAFEPAKVEVRQGETIRFVLTNRGELAHEFVLDSHDEILEHKAMMEKMPDMQHDDPNALRLEPGASGELVWKFSGNGDLEFACLIPGHYELGMKGEVTVSQD